MYLPVDRTRIHTNHDHHRPRRRRRRLAEGETSVGLFLIILLKVHKLGIKLTNSAKLIMLKGRATHIEESSGVNLIQIYYFVFKK